MEIPCLVASVFDGPSLMSVPRAPGDRSFRISRYAAPREQGAQAPFSLSRPARGKVEELEGRSGTASFPREPKEERCLERGGRLPENGSHVIGCSSCRITERRVFPASLFIISSNLPA